jgi:folylpolyglutamate synthase/dihydropteroate synthase
MLENNEIAFRITKEVLKGMELDEEKLKSLILESQQPCRFEKVNNRSENIVIDVCHNIEGFRAVFGQIREAYPCIKKVKVVMALSKTKKLEELV